MREVHVDELVQGVRYRIHANGEEDTLGTFVVFNANHVPVFNQLNISHLDGRYKLNPTLELKYPSDHYTFYKSAKTIKDENKRHTLRVALDRLVPGLGDARNEFGGKRKTKRRRIV